MPNWLRKGIELYIILVLGLSLGIGLSSGCQKKSRREKSNPEFFGVGVKVINSTGVHRLAWIVAWDMINRGFNVYGTGDTCDSFEHTVVVDLKDSSAKNARAVAEGLKAEKRIAILPMKREMLPRIEVKIDSTRFVDVLLILGEDYRVFFPAVEPFN